jgi:glycine cleavage system H protein
MKESLPKSGEFLEGKLWFERKGVILTVGLTDIAVEEIGTVESLELPSDGESFDKDDVVAIIEGSKGKLEATAPIAGVVHEINEVAQEEPESVSDDPFDEGWLFKLELSE